MASTLKVDTITGVATAGSIAITGEGNSTTTNLQNGLAKVWIAFDQGLSASSAQSIDGSFNVSSISDGGLGETIITLTNAMADGNHAVTCTTGSGESNRFPTYNLPRTTLIKFETFRVSDNSAQDAGEASALAHGDLA